MECKNCGNEVNSDNKYCGKCGGRVVMNRFTLNSLAQEAFGDVFGWDSRFWDTLLTLFNQPGKLIQGYLDGHRGRYMNPFSLYAFLLSISVILSTVFQSQINELMSQYNSMLGQSNVDTGWIFNYQSLIAFLSLPLYALLSFLTFRKPYNYGEHLLINVFTMSINTFLSTFFLLICITLNAGILYIFGGFAMMFIVYIYVYHSLYQPPITKWLWYIPKFLFLLVLFYILIVLVIIGIIILSGSL